MKQGSLRLGVTRSIVSLIVLSMLLSMASFAALADEVDDTPYPADDGYYFCLNDKGYKADDDYTSDDKNDPDDKSDDKYNQNDDYKDDTDITDDTDDISDDKYNDDINDEDDDCEYNYCYCEYYYCYCDYYGYNIAALGGPILFQPFGTLYTVTFNANAGEFIGAITVVTVDVLDGTSLGALMPSSPSRGGFAFRSWHTTSDEVGGSVFTAATIVTGNITVYAQWGRLLQFNGNGINLLQGTDVNNPAHFLARNIRDNYTVLAMPGVVWPNNPTRAGFQFGGWNTNSAGVGMWVDETTTITTGMTLYAIWTFNPIVTIEFDPQGALASGIWAGLVTRDAKLGISIWNSTSAATFDGVVGPGPLNPGLAATPTNPTRTGWTFIGWRTQPTANHGSTAGLPGTVFTPGTNATNGTLVTAALAPPPPPLFDPSDDRTMTVYADWAHRVTFNSNGGAQGSPVVDIRMSGTPFAATAGAVAPAVSRAGFTFEGWYFGPTAIDGNGVLNPTGAAFDPTTTIINSTITVFARWTPNPNVTITFHSGSGATMGTFTGTMGGTLPNVRELTVTQNGSLQSAGLAVIPAPTPPAGYLFWGYYMAPGGAGGLFLRSTTIGADTDVWAHFVPYHHTVTLMRNDGTGNVWNTFQARNGFSIHNDFRTATTAATNTNQTYMVNRGTGATSTNPATIVGHSINASGHPVISNTTLSFTGHVFVEWNTMPCGSGTSFTNAEVAIGAITSSKTLYAIWTVMRTLSFNNNFATIGGSSAVVAAFTKTIPDGFAIYNMHTHPSTPNTIRTMPTMTAGGHSFVGWNELSSGLGNWLSADTPITANQTVFAVWSVGVTFLENGAGAVILNQYRNIPNVAWPFTLGAQMPPNPTWVDHDFARWSTNNVGTGTTLTGTTVLLGPTTVFAIWTARVFFDGTGGTIVGGIPQFDGTHRVNQYVNLSIGSANFPTVSRTNHSFAGWNTELDGSGLAFTAASVVHSTQTVFAQWDSTVTFNGNGGTVLAANATRTIRSATTLGAQMPPNPTHVNPAMSFVGWFTVPGSTGGTQITSTSNINGHVTAYARWASYSITYVSVGHTAGTVPVDAVLRNAGDTVTVMGQGTLQRAGFVFGGWTSNFDAVTRSGGATFTMPSGNVVFTAVWNPVSGGGAGPGGGAGGGGGGAGGGGGGSPGIPAGPAAPVTPPGTVTTPPTVVPPDDNNGANGANGGGTPDPADTGDNNQDNDGGLPFVDVMPNDWFYGAINNLHEHGAFEGLEDPHFMGDLPLTRGMAILILYNISGRPSIDHLDHHEFTDVADNRWYTEAVIWGAHHGVILGFGDGTYRPNDYVIRAHLTLILDRFTGFADVSLQSVATFMGFYDFDAIKYYQLDSVISMYEAGVVVGRTGNVFDPQTTATRAEFIMMFYRFLRSQ